MLSNQKPNKPSNKSQTGGRLERLSMGDLSSEDALRGALQVPTPKSKPKKRKTKRKRTPKKH